jgi:hypothetical protein
MLRCLSTFERETGLGAPDPAASIGSRYSALAGVAGG